MKLIVLFVPLFFLAPTAGKAREVNQPRAPRILEDGHHKVTSQAVLDQLIAELNVKGERCEKLVSEGLLFKWNDSQQDMQAQRAAKKSECLATCRKVADSWIGLNPLTIPEHHALNEAEADYYTDQANRCQ